MTETLIIDAHGVYDPRQLDDRLLLGLKGTMSEFELGLFRRTRGKPLNARFAADTHSGKYRLVLYATKKTKSRRLPIGKCKLPSRVCSPSFASLAQHDRQPSGTETSRSLYPRLSVVPRGIKSFGKFPEVGGSIRYSRTPATPGPGLWPHRRPDLRRERQST